MVKLSAQWSSEGMFNLSRMREKTSFEEKTWKDTEGNFQVILITLITVPDSSYLDIALP